ncbi:MAG: hypothetical protein LAE24_00320 [Candidatus Contendobacter sp.]|nr:hypothetical protein [Candidatus Contendobacter sp.]
MTKTLHLLIPGLLESMRFDPADSLPALAAPALHWLLARADARPAPVTPDETLFQLFNVPIPAAADLPVAAVTRLADGGELDAGWWLRADPVHLCPDWRGIFLTDARVLAIKPAEAQALTAAFNETFAVDGLHLDARRLNRWYLRLTDDPDIRTYPLLNAIGRDISRLLPHGPNRRRWHPLLTEAQMLFHGHPVNRAREERHQPLINGLWLWGGGMAPTDAKSPAAGLYGNDPLLCGLARLANVAIAPVPEHAGDWLDSAEGEADSLVALETMRYDLADGDPASWVDHLAELEVAWFTHCQRWLQTGKLAALHLYPGNGRVYTLTGVARWRFWRRAQPWSAFRDHAHSAATLVTHP